MIDNSRIVFKIFFFIISTTEEDVMKNGQSNFLKTTCQGFLFVLLFQDKVPQVTIFS
jgi:hypothetical protein